MKTEKLPQRIKKPITALDIKQTLTIGCQRLFYLFL